MWGANEYSGNSTARTMPPKPKPKTSNYDNTLAQGAWVQGLCIGVDKYEHLSELTNAVRDARAVAQKVQGECSVPIHLDRAGSGV